MSEHKITKTHNGRVVLGVFLICVGIVLLCNNLNIVLFGAWKDAIFSVPMVLIVCGFVAIFRKSYCGGLCALGTGLFFILPKVPYDIVPDNFIGTWGPLLWIYLGVVLILFRKTVVSKNIDNELNADNMHLSDAFVSNEGKVSHSCFLSGAKLKYSEPVFKGGDLRATFGGIELDLSKSALQSGENHLYISSFFGGVTVLIPNTWTVDIQMNGALGGFEDKRKIVAPENNGSKLIIHANCFLGGGELRTVENSI